VSLRPIRARYLIIGDACKSSFLGHASENLMSSVAGPLTTGASPERSQGTPACGSGSSRFNASVEVKVGK